MAGFRFKLDPVLAIRRRAEEAQQRVVAEAVLRVVRLDERAGGLRTLRGAQLQQSGQGERSGVLDPGRLRLRYGHEVHLMHTLSALASERESLQETVDRERKKLAALAAQRKVLERLREKRHEAHVREQQRREQMETDEVAVGMVMRSRRSEEPMGN